MILRPPPRPEAEEQRVIASSIRGRSRKKRAELEAFLDKPYVILVPVTYTAAERFSRMGAALRAIGRPIAAIEMSRQ